MVKLTTIVRDKLVNIQKSLGALIIGAYKDTEAEAVDLNTSQMNDRGIKSDGTDIGEYSPYTIELKKLKGQQTGFVTLKDDGDFQSAMGFKNIREEYAEISSTDWKTQGLESKYGEDIFGLTTENTNEYAKESWYYSFINGINKIWQR